MKNISKTIAVTAFILWLLAMWKSSKIFEPKQVSIEIEEDSGRKQGVKEEPGAITNSFAHTEELLNSPSDDSKYQLLRDNNIFAKPERPPEIFTPEKLELVSAYPTTLPLLYAGFIEMSDGRIVGQINWSGKTYFVKKGDNFNDYKVLEINSKFIKAKNKEGQLTLDYKKPVKGKNMLAKLRDTMDGKVYEVKKSDEIRGYKILDIKADSVLLYGENKEWVINKGR